MTARVNSFPRHSKVTLKLVRKIKRYCRLQSNRGLDLKVISSSSHLIVHRLFQPQSRRTTPQVKKVKKAKTADCFFLVCFVFLGETWNVMTWDGLVIELIVGLFKCGKILFLYEKFQSKLCFYLVL